jgi:hypothetical protein
MISSKHQQTQYRTQYCHLILFIQTWEHLTQVGNLSLSTCCNLGPCTSCVNELLIHMQTVAFDGQGSAFYSFLMLNNHAAAFPIIQTRRETWRWIPLKFLMSHVLWWVLKGCGDNDPSGMECLFPPTLQYPTISGNLTLDQLLFSIPEFSVNLSWASKIHESKLCSLPLIMSPNPCT